MRMIQRPGLWAFAAVFVAISTIRKNSISKTIDSSSSVPKDPPSITPLETNITSKYNQTTENNTTVSYYNHTLPSFNDSGVILFYHLAKTGGVTIRNIMKDMEHVEFLRASNTSEFEHISENISMILNRTTQPKILFVELHAGQSLPGLAELSPIMQQWHRLSQQHDIPFFAFTLLRDPIHVHVSAFLFFHLLRCTASWCSVRKSRPSEKNLLNSITPNRLCSSLARGQDHEDLIYQNVSAGECLEVEKLLRQDWNWVGTTEEISTTTLPMVFEMLHYIPKNTTSSNVSSRGDLLNVKNISQATRMALKNQSKLDYKLYNAFKTR